MQKNVALLLLLLVVCYSHTFESTLTLDHNPIDIQEYDPLLNYSFDSVDNGGDKRIAIVHFIVIGFIHLSLAVPFGQLIQLTKYRKLLTPVFYQSNYVVFPLLLKERNLF
ncbi:hypothetical protein [Salirhabdus sp. Marseille-P4669]|uniref:hypothetical protein n=1 Tax=Salirhabdus sp. Marseille-P4669 TaxID=2042310 RepID=UPI000C7B8DCD|nr:hypothetical protein [Salirhabdus sp. Marseille-P4669]